MDCVSSNVYLYCTSIIYELMFMCHVLLIFQTLVLYLMYLVVCMQEFDKSII
jgi:hypothetical protein